MPSIPRVSVVIPCFNLRQYIDEAVDSVFAQTFREAEIIVVNDGSTDRLTNERLREYRDERIGVPNTGNRGLAHARNLEISAARDEFVCALDADDTLVPTFVEKAIASFDQHPGVAFVSSWLESDV